MYFDIFFQRTVKLYKKTRQIILGNQTFKEAFNNDF